MVFLLILTATFAVLFFFLYFLARQEITRLDERNQRIDQEKQLVLDFMHNLVEALGEGLTRKELFQRIVHAAVLSTGALSGCVFERTGEETVKGSAVEGLFPLQGKAPDPSDAKVTTRVKFIEKILRSETIAFGEGLIGFVAREREAVLIRDAANDPRIVQHDDPALAVKSMIAAPIMFRGKLIGVLAVANSLDGISFNETDFSLVQNLADQAGLAIHNADLLNLQLEKKKLDLDLSLASNVQKMLLPKEYPKLSELEMDAVYIPAQKIGGDLYDFFQMPGNRVAVAIADVSGKGIPASLLMATCRCNLRHFSKLYDSPARILMELNRSMTPEMHQDMFITLIYAIVDVERREIVFARAGHELPLHSRYEAQKGIVITKEIGSEGIAVGLVESHVFDAVIEDKRVAISPGDTFLFYTDGVTEAANEEGTEFSTARLIDTMRTLGNRSCKELNQKVLDAVERFAGHDGIDDDISLVSLKLL